MEVDPSMLSRNECFVQKSKKKNSNDEDKELLLFYMTVINKVIYPV